MLGHDMRVLNIFIKLPKIENNYAQNFNLNHTNHHNISGTIASKNMINTVSTTGTSTSR
jgi:hypothetical protein